jgi:hypothetical protein
MATTTTLRREVITTGAAAEESIEVNVVIVAAAPLDEAAASGVQDVSGNPRNRAITDTAGLTHQVQLGLLEVATLGSQIGRPDQLVAQVATQ